MASKRELIEAHKYSRRRLVSAFVSGSPQGKEVESLSRARPVVAGIVLTVLLVAGVGLSGLLSPGLPDDWDQQGVVITEEGGERFLALDGTLYPVINASSARLMLPAESGFRVEIVPDDAVADAPRGATIGIIGAPDDLPAPDRLEQTGWAACLAPGGSTYLDLDPAGAVADDDTSAVVVEHDGAHTLVAGGLRYEIPPADHASILRVLALDTVPPVTAPGAFLDLYTAGETLEWPLGSIAGLGEPLPEQVSAPEGATAVGQLVRNVDVGGAPSILSRNGAAPISEFAAALYSVQAPDGLGNALELTNADLVAVPNDTAGYVPETWPAALPGTTSDQPCVVLHTTPDGRARTTFATAPAQADIFAARRVAVAPGSGALVRSSSTGTDAGPVFLIDQTATRFEITNPSQEILARLGYADVSPARVPSAWLAHFGDGPALDPATARLAVSRSLATGES